MPLMAKNLDRLIAYLLDRIALCGAEGEPILFLICIPFLQMIEMQRRHGHHIGVGWSFSPANPRLAEYS